MLVTLRGEIEPNNDLTEANVHTLPAHGSAADYIGFGVKGSIDDTIDSADCFVFTVSRTHTFAIELCSVIAGAVPSCGPIGTAESIDTSVAYFEVFDQDGTLLLGSQANITVGNSHEIIFDAGIAYYLGVFAEDTVGMTTNYLIEAVEQTPVPQDTS